MPDPVFNPGGGDSELTIPMDAVGDSAPISSFSMGYSIMPISAEATVEEWEGWEVPATLITIRTASGGRQEITWDDAEDSFAWRVWLPTVEEWGGWNYPLNYADNIVPGPEDGNGEGGAPADYSPGYAFFPVTAGQNWGPNSGQAGIVETWMTTSGGVQVFTTYSNAQYRRAGTASWSAWADTKGSS